MKERPILMSAPMVRACLDGSKTQTRRAVKPQPFAGQTDDEARAFFVECGAMQTDESLTWLLNGAWAAGFIEGVKCPYGAIGDRLYVRENGWERPERTDKMMREGADTWAPFMYDADGVSASEAAELKAQGWKRRPSIHLPRRGSRLELEIADISIEKLQDISDADARAEGCPCYVCGGPLNGRSESNCHCFHRSADATDYRNLWNQINGAGAWDANPWVWVIEFKRVKP